MPDNRNFYLNISIKSMLKELKVASYDRYQLVDITSEIEAVVSESRVQSGIVIVFVPHSTAGVLITEDESGLKDDWMKVLKNLVSGFEFFHNWVDNNASAHILSGLIGQVKTFVIEKGKLVNGSWQQIFLAEFDGPIERKVIVKIIEG